MVDERTGQESLTGVGRHASVQPACEREGRKILDRVKDGHGGDNELPFWQEPFGLRQSWSNESDGTRRTKRTSYRREGAGKP